MKHKIIIGLCCGFVIGIIDVVPMVIQKLPWDADLSAFFMWIVCGFFISTSQLKIHPVLKGIIFGFLCLLPSAFIIGWQEPQSLIPIAITTTVLGGLLGYSIKKFDKN
jgi:hypothetical protein